MGVPKEVLTDKESEFVLQFLAEIYDTSYSMFEQYRYVGVWTINLHETWESSPRSSESIMSYVLAKQEKLESIIRDRRTMLSEEDAKPMV